MKEPPSCKTCGTPLRLDAPMGQCPSCLFDLGSMSMGEHTATDESTIYGGNYEIFEELGRGGMGVVFRARQISLNRAVAIKKLAAHGAAYPELAQRLRFEAEAAASLNHPHIIRIYEVGEQDGQPFFSMELVEGKGLNRFISSRGLSLEGVTLPPECKRQGRHAVAALLAAKISRAADHAHKHGIIHRDLKPANVIIDQAGEPYLTDFGLAKALHPDQGCISDSNIVKGTAAYMAPEQVTGPKEKVSTSTDVYGLGAILYNMLAGRAPFKGDGPMEILHQVVHDAPPHPDTLQGPVDPDLATICLKCLEKDPKQRYESALALADDLERWLRREPIEARPVGHIGRAWRWCCREPTLAGLVLGLFLFVTVSSILSLILYQREKSIRLESERRSILAKDRFLDRIERSWNDGALAVDISAEDLQLFRNVTKPVLFEEVATRVNLAIRTVERIPDLVVVPFFDLMDYLQSYLWQQAGVPVTFDLRLYTSDMGMLSEISSRRVDIWHLDPAIYVLTRDQLTRTNAILVREIRHPDHGYTRGLIVTAPDSGVTNLTSLRGRSFAFGEANTALGWYLPQSLLWQAGLRASDLGQMTNLLSGRVLTAVRNRTLDAGVVNREDFERMVDYGVSLRILEEIEAPNPLWVITSELNPIVVAELRRALEQQKDSLILSHLEPALVGYSSAVASDYDQLKEAIEFAKKFGDL